MLGEPGAAVDGAVELEDGVGARVGAQRLPVGLGPHLRQLVPAAELSQDPLVWVPGEFGQAVLLPGFEVVQGAVELGKAASGDKERMQVGNAALVG